MKRSVYPTRFLVATVLALTLHTPALLAADKPQPVESELFSEYLDINQPDLRIKGKVTLHSLSPLRVEILFNEARGDGAKILGLISKWYRLPPDVLAQITLGETTLQESTLLITQEGTRLVIAAATIPEGKLEKLNLNVDKLSQRLTFDVERLALRGFPIKNPNIPHFTTLSAAGLKGSRQENTISVNAAFLATDGLTANKIQFNQTPKGGGLAWHTQGEKATLDLARLQTLLRSAPNGAKAMDNQIREWGLKKLELGGIVDIANANLSGLAPAHGISLGTLPTMQGSLRPNWMKGRVLVEGRPKGWGFPSNREEFKIELASQQVRLLEGERIELDATNATITPAKGGGVHLSGNGAWPANPKRRLTCALDPGATTTSHWIGKTLATKGLVQPCE